jgi:tRNA threonylcarbamoyl adenosine modification protein YeaZ
MITLALDASTYEGDVAVLRDGQLLAERSTAMKGANEERLMPAVAAALDAAGVTVRDVDRVVCGAGPGSFTSLRIAGAIAKGIATGVGCALYAVPSMGLIAGGAELAAGRYLVAVDALRGEVYVGLYDLEPGGVIHEVERARIVAAANVNRIAAEYDAAVVSPTPTLGGIVARPRARAVASFDALLAERGPVDVASWEPSYGRLAEAQVRWESAHGKPLPTG